MACSPTKPKSAKSVFPPYWMLREIAEQSHAIQETLRHHVSGTVIFPSTRDSIAALLSDSQKIIIAASGSSRHAGLAAEIIFENLADVAVDVEYSSEYCYRSPSAEPDKLVLLITQSGETADTIAAERRARQRGANTIAITNAPGSTIAREANAVLPTYAGEERAIPATKSFTTQLAVLYLLALFLAKERRTMNPATVDVHLQHLGQVPAEIAASLPRWQEQTLEWARDCQAAKAFLFLGRGIHYAIAREGALKLKETSYVHAEGLPAGELLHGPNALIDKNFPIVFLATRDPSLPDSMLRHEKTLSVLENAKARGAKTLVIANEGDIEVAALASHVISVPAASELLLPLLEVIPLQLFAYHFAVLNGCDVDRPRNLVKAVVKG